MSANLLEPGDDAAPSLPQPEAEGKPELPVESKPKPEVKPEEAKTERESDDPETKYNNVRAALKEERQEKAALKRQLDELGERSRQFDSIRHELEEHRRKVKEAEEKARFEENPAEYLKTQVETLNERQQQLLEESTRANQEYIKQAQFMQSVQSQTAAFAKETADYVDAFSFIHDRRLKEYEVLGVPAEEWEGRFNQESIDFAGHAMRQGKNPAEMVYKMAGAWGYTKSQQKPKAETEIERLQAGQAAAATLSKGGAGEESVLKRIEEMSDKEFEDYWATLKPASR